LSGAAELLDALHEAVLVLDRQGRIARVNAPACALFGYAEGELLRRPVTAVLPAASLPAAPRRGSGRVPAAWPTPPPSPAQAHCRDGSLLRVRITPAREGSGARGRPAWVVHPVNAQPVQAALAPHAAPQAAAAAHAAADAAVSAAPAAAPPAAPSITADAAQQFAALLNMATDAILSVDQSQRLTLFNRGAEEIFGYRAEEVLGRPFDLLIPPRFRERHGHWVRAFARDPRDSRRMNERSHIYGLRANGEEFVAEASITRLTVNGATLYSALLRDVTDREQALAALHASQRLLRTAFDALPLWITVKDRAGLYIMTNQRVLEDVGTSEDALLGLTSEQLPYGTAEDRKVLIELDGRILSGSARTISAEVPVHPDGGPPRVRQVIKVPLLDDAEQVTGVVTVSMDITERKRAEAELRASEERYRYLVEGFIEGIAIHRGDVPLFVNRAFAALFGYATAEAVLALGSLGALVEAPEPDAGAAARALWYDAAAPELGAVPFTGVRLDGSHVRIEKFSRVIQWQGRSAIQSVLVDVTERERLEAQLRQAQKMEAVGQLAGGVAHDFNNLLQVVRGYAELATHRVTDAGRMRDYLTQILRATEGGSHLVRQMLTFSRRDVLRPRALDVNELVDDALKMLRRVIPEHIELRFKPAAPLPTVHADRGMIEQALINLCVNARDAMPDGGLLTLRTSLENLGDEHRTRDGLLKPGRYVVIEVADTGTGIAPEHLGRIFEPFFTTKEAGRGTGLGLSMAYGSIQQHGGTIAVQSELGQGTTFRMHLPVNGEAAAQPPPPGAAAPRGGDECILVAEDSGMVLGLLGELLRGEGYRILEARDGEEALQTFLSHQDEVQLAILDLVMPRLSGAEVYRRIRGLRPALPVLFSTGYSASVVDTAFLEQHRERIIHKPYHPDELYRRVRVALQGAQAASA
jgi:two-component system, cell cycle sensor histidine kinase and response regulator CckA